MNEQDVTRPEWVGWKEALEILKVSRSTLQTWREKRIIDYLQYGSKILYPRKDLEEFMRQRLQKHQHPCRQQV